MKGFVALMVCDMLLNHGLGSKGRLRLPSKVKRPFYKCMRDSPNAAETERMGQVTGDRTWTEAHTCLMV